MHFTLTFSCPDRPGIVAAISTALAEKGADILETHQFSDQSTRRLFMRLAFTAPAPGGLEEIRASLSPVQAKFGMTMRLHDSAVLPRLIIMVSKFDHALLNLLYQVRVNWLRAEIVAIVSNHQESATAAKQAGIPYYYWPVTKDNKSEQEDRLRALVTETRADLIVLARYMQVLSDAFSTEMSGRIINIHHSFLPSFKGARPYHQAFARGVKLIGATAHYVTPDLDEGPIIEQETARVTHSLSAEDYVATGRSVESQVLARAVKLHVEQRVMLNGHRTIIFS
ncbi:formyltetrahydrofolate deformylase [Acetobacter orleanensis]|uniref:Formyltetrahydrofolate deformylase n=1 Tax=Acetobacter orleanensis TaxID=104099 RepID=A0A4Y3TKB7_9PROT|nr:formyltetrahydrofolate deformylase [Acetobacter orleanensis]KXV63923.1 formyltetrahydrofolate deformylase [Acetobacter orleanensis]PCD79694.1 formyltetrahydrofolate deformylase [Acetobacter orleanensis]GAN69256.1 formyltetrahydrofolate deformylase [Acetobacter orleanensis JCM 7639]GBR28198.1 formyltetrahydrofolate deformylase [Acetobacter orleanensis NRIC 0473]GEB82218.1 formyltetrahydrofolate deformylase [Acetobacter orleanensis]